MQDDPIRDYLVGIGRYKLLKPHEEVELSQQIQILRDIDALQKGRDPRLTDEELAAHFQMDVATLNKKRVIAKRAKNRMIECNLRLVVSIATRYNDTRRNIPLTLRDMIQEGSIGLNRAVEKFDHTKGFKFSTYATAWVKQAITRSLSNDSRMIRLPIHICEKLNYIRSGNRKFFAQWGRNPTLEELEPLIGFDPRPTLNWLKQSSVASLHTRIGEDDNSELIDFIADDCNDEYEPVSSEMMSEMLADAMATLLSEQEREVLALRYGLADGEKKGLTEVGRAMSVSGQRIQQIEKLAVKKIQGSQRGQQLRQLIVN